MAPKLGGWILYFAAVAVVLFIGWNEPIRYRFKSPAEIDAIEHPTPPPTPPPVPPPTPPPPPPYHSPLVR
jgi:hypothetical protein